MLIPGGCNCTEGAIKASAPRASGVQIIFNRKEYLFLGEQDSGMNTKPYLVVSGIIFALIAIGHGLRLGFQWPLKVGAWSIPLWASAGAVVVTIALFVWAFWLARK